MVDTRTMGEIKVIHGGFAGGGESGSARKAHLRKLRPDDYKEINAIEHPHKIQKAEEVYIIFTEEDATGIRFPNDNPLVMTVIVANFLTSKV